MERFEARRCAKFFSGMHHLLPRNPAVTWVGSAPQKREASCRKWTGNASKDPCPYAARKVCLHAWCSALSRLALDRAYDSDPSLGPLIHLRLTLLIRSVAMAALPTRLAQAPGVSLATPRLSDARLPEPERGPAPQPGPEPGAGVAPGPAWRQGVRAHPGAAPSPALRVCRHPSPSSSGCREGLPSGGG